MLLTKATLHRLPSQCRLPSTPYRIQRYHLNLSPSETAKQAAAHAAVDRYILPVTKTIGIGSGSTVPYVVDKIVNQGRIANESRVFLPTSFQSRQLILAAGLRLGDINEYAAVDVTIDGADEIDSNLNAIKGGGACHLQEKVVAEATSTWVMIAESHKRSNVLGTKWKKGVPIEIVTFGYIPVIRALNKLGATAHDGHPLSLRMGKMKAGPVITDNGNFVVDALFPPGRMQEPEKLAQDIKQISGVLEVGLFCGIAKAAVYGYENGTSEIVESQSKSFQ